MKTEILPYQRIGNTGGNSEKAKGYKILNQIITKNNLILLPVAFLLGRANLLGGLMPFGISAYAATYGLDVNRILVALFILLGMFSAGAKEQIYMAIAGMLLFNAFNLPFRNNKSKADLRYGIAAFSGTLVPQLVIVYLQGFLLYDFLKALLNSGIVFLLVFIYRKASSLVGDTRKKYAFSNEEMISFAIVAALALSGLSDIQVFGLNVKNAMCILVILIFGYKCGSGIGSAIGVTVGLIVSMSSTVTPLVIGSYAFCGLLAGVMKSLGKVGSALGFVLGNAILTIYLNGSSEVLIHLKETTLAIIAFLLIPNKWMEITAGAFIRSIDAITDKRSYSLRIKEITVEKLNKFSRAFKELSRTFSEISQTSVVTDKQDISSMFDRVADKVCKDCSLCLHCWDRNFYNTYQVMFKIIEKLDVKGRIEEKDIPEYFLERCERINDFVEAVNNIYEIFKVDMVWKNRIGESRGLVSQQFDGLSKVISNLAAEIDMDVHFKRDLEDSILLELNKAGVRATEVIVYENKWGKLEISVFSKGCGGKRSCLNQIEKIVTDTAGRRMVKENSDCNQKAGGTCTLKLVEEETFKITTGVAKLPKHDGKVSGDSYTFMSTGDGKYIAAISDGMGSGHKAAIQSRAAISLLEQFMESGFDKDTTIKLINSILVLKSSDEAFATIDLSVIDLYGGEVEFVKIGAIPTFIKKNDRVEVVRSASLPAGILSNIDIELVHKKIENGEFIVMMTDGIVDSFKGDEDGVKELQKFMEGINSANPQQIADSILNEAYLNCNGQPADDMLVLVAKVWKKTR